MTDTDYQLAKFAVAIMFMAIPTVTVIAWIVGYFRQSGPAKPTLEPSQDYRRLVRQVRSTFDLMHMRPYDQKRVTWEIPGPVKIVLCGDSEWYQFNCLGFSINVFPDSCCAQKLPETPLYRISGQIHNINTKCVGLLHGTVEPIPTCCPD